ncbi:MAG: hypothetical protein J6N77_04520, partial [Lachnospiraceae bacterium]|nr:hypothetical protein [Lachnospiraceae bacterium]
EEAATIEANKVAAVSFSNTYNDTYHGGGSVTNKYTATAGEGESSDKISYKDPEQIYDGGK